MNRARRLRLFETLEDDVTLYALIGRFKLTPRANSWLSTAEREGAYTCGDLEQLGRECQQECYKTIDLIAEYNNFTWECKHLAIFPPSSLETERENLISWVL